MIMITQLPIKIKLMKGKKSQKTIHNKVIFLVRIIRYSIVQDML